MAENNARYRRQWEPDPTHDNDSLTKIYNLISDKSAVLDVGCSVGQLGSMLIARKQCHVTGIDIDPDSVAEAQKVLDQALVGNVLETPLEKIVSQNKFDYVIFADVLEHLNQPVQVLKDAQKVLSDSGAILISIPNVSHASVRLSLLEGRFDYTREGLLDRTHVLFYTKKSLLEMLEEAGLTVVEFDRTLLSARDSDIPIRESTLLSPELIKTVEHQEEAITYQFIVKAVAPSHPLLQTGVKDHLKKVEQQMKDLRMELTEARQLIGGTPTQTISETTRSFTERLEAMESHLGAQKADLLKRIQDYEIRIKDVEYATERRIADFARSLGISGTDSSSLSLSSIEKRVEKCESLTSRLWDLLPIRLWRRARNIK